MRYLAPLVLLLLLVFPARAQQLNPAGGGGGGGGGALFSPGPVSITGNSGNGTDQISGVCVNGVCSPLAWGAYADGKRDNTCSIAAAGTSITCTDNPFTPSDVGKIGGFQQAGTAVAGGPNNTLLFTVASFSSASSIGITVTANGPATAISSGGVVVWGHDDRVAINNTVTGAKSIYARVDMANGVYISSGTVNLGNPSLGNPGNQAHAMDGNKWKIYFLIPNFTSNGLFAQGQQIPGAAYAATYQNGQDFYPIDIGNGEVDCMDTGLDCLVLGADDMAHIHQMTINNSFRNGLALTPPDNSGPIGGGRTWIEQPHLDQITIMSSGHHCVYQAQLGAQNKNNNDGIYDKIDCRAYGFNSARILAAAGGPAAPWSSWTAGVKCPATSTSTCNSQLGAAWYFIGTAPSASWFGFNCNSCTNDAGALWAQHFGSNVNPASVVYADGQIDHQLEPKGTTGVTNTFEQFIWQNPRFESVGGFGTQTGTYQIWAEDGAVIPNVAAHGVINPLSDGSYTNTENVLGANGNWEFTANYPGGQPQFSFGGPSVINGQSVARLAPAAAAPSFSGGSSNAVVLNATTFTTIMGAFNSSALVLVRPSNGSGNALLLVDQFNTPTLTQIVTSPGLTFQMSGGALQAKAASGTPSVAVVSLGP